MGDIYNRHLWYVVSKDIQGGEVAQGACGQNHRELIDGLQQMANLQNLTEWDTGGRDLGRIWNGWKRLLDPRPRYVLIPFWHPPGDKKGWFV